MGDFHRQFPGIRAEPGRVGLGLCAWPVPVVGDDDVSGLRGREAGIQRPDHGHGQGPADNLGGDEGRRGGGAMPAKVSENIRPMVMAGLAKLVEEVKKYAAPI